MRYLSESVMHPCSRLNNCPNPHVIGFKFVLFELVEEVNKQRYEYNDVRHDSNFLAACKKYMKSETENESTG